MSYAEDKARAGSISAFKMKADDAALFSAEKTPEAPRDTAVETLADQLREVACLFAFKDPLGSEFDTAADHAQNCLEYAFPPAPRRVGDWIRNCLKCLDCICLIYWRDVLGQEVPSRPDGKCYERDLYSSYLGYSDADVRAVGAAIDTVYERYRNPLEHTHVMKNGRREIKRVGDKERRKSFDRSRNHFKEALDRLVPWYQAAFPDACVKVE